jgi:hypothetical protein
VSILSAVVDQAARYGSGQTLGVTKAVIDPRYDSTTENYDAALVRLSTPVTGISPVGIDPAGSGDTAFAQPGASATVIGYGSVDPEAINGDGSVDYPSSLEYAPVVIATDTTCASVFNGTRT